MSEKVIEWRCSWRTRCQFWELVEELANLNEDTEEYMDTLERVYLLPGFPMEIDLTAPNAPLVHVVSTTAGELH